MIYQKQRREEEYPANICMYIQKKIVKTDEQQTRVEKKTKYIQPDYEIVENK